MANNLTTKRALWSSVLALFLCFTMLLGTTYAWFTDSVTSANNIIKAGTLNVEMYWAEGTEEVNAAKWQDASRGAIFNYDLWEPGYVTVRHIKIENTGTLSLKYQLSIVANGEVSKLADVIDVYYADPATQITSRDQLTEKNKLGTLTEVLKNISVTASGNLLAGENHTVTLALKMQESAGNDYQGLSIGTDFSVQLIATQYTAEEDAFNNLYDEDAPAVFVSTLDELTAALAAGESVKLMNDITASDIITVSGSSVFNGNGYTLTSTADRAINVSGANGAQIKNLKIEASGERAINVIQGSTNVVIDNVTATANNYTVNVAGSATGAVVTVQNSDLTGLNVVNVGAAGALVSVTNTKITCDDQNEIENYAALCLNKDATNSVLTADNCTFVINGDSFKARNTADGGQLTIDGSDAEVRSNSVAATYGAYYYAFETLQDAIDYATEQQLTSISLQLTRDIVVTETITIPAGLTVALDLNGKTVSQTKGDCTTSYSMIRNLGTLTISDITGNGKISFTDTTPYTKDPGFASNTIRNDGTLVVKGGTIENLTPEEVMNYGYPHAIDAYQGSVTTIEGGTVKSLNYDAIRMFCNSATLATTVNITGGTIVNRVSFQDPNGTTAGYGILNISGGNFITTDEVSANVRLLNFCANCSNMKATVTGGTFDKGFKTQDFVSAGITIDTWLINNTGATLPVLD